MSATPRTIETVEELRALTGGTRLLGRDYKPGCGRLWRVEKFGVVDIERPLDGICGFNYFKDPLPAIVLTEPEAEARALDATQPRAMSTVEELDALQDGVILRCNGVTYEHHDGWFHGVDGSNVTAELISLPAVILLEEVSV